ncbi:uncharacterized protein LOC134783235 [Penaeus indicus]|uniref:uncharacterized protein LOC134783235 n=1 Tax=Penaeus indicus TaxID=29960 RepID=UPI00300DBA73
MYSYPPKIHYLATAVSAKHRVVGVETAVTARAPLTITVRKDLWLAWSFFIMADIDFSELSGNLSEHVVVDVRNRNEVEDSGQIPGSHCIPLPELETAMDLSDEDFESKYGFSKPSTSTSIVTHCLKGGRARRAGDIFKSKGYQASVRCECESENEGIGECEAAATLVTEKISIMADIEYTELSTNFSDLVVFDVRNRHELEEKGQILGSNCVPFVELESAMEMAEDAFEAKYGLKKPTKTTPIITHCTKGGRARKAGDLLKSMGYNARQWEQGQGQLEVTLSYVTNPVVTVIRSVIRSLNFCSTGFMLVPLTTGKPTAAVYLTLGNLTRLRIKGRMVFGRGLYLLFCNAEITTFRTNKQYHHSGDTSSPHHYTGGSKWDKHHHMVDTLVLSEPKSYTMSGQVLKINFPCCRNLLIREISECLLTLK